MSGEFWQLRPPRPHTVTSKQLLDAFVAAPASADGPVWVVTPDTAARVRWAEDHGVEVVWVEIGE